MPGNLGIGTTTANAPLQFAPSLASRKIVLYDGANNDNQVYGLGVNSYAMRYQVGDLNSSHIFYAGSSATTSNELMRIQGNGNVGIGTSSPSEVLDVTGNAKFSGALMPGGSAGTAGYLLQSNGTGHCSHMGKWANGP